MLTSDLATWTQTPGHQASPSPPPMATPAAQSSTTQTTTQQPCTWSTPPINSNSTGGTTPTSPTQHPLPTGQPAPPSLTPPTVHRSGSTWTSTLPFPWHKLLVRACSRRIEIRIQYGLLGGRVWEINRRGRLRCQQMQMESKIRICMLSASVWARWASRWNMLLCSRQAMMLRFCQRYQGRFRWWGNCLLVVVREQGRKKRKGCAGHCFFLFWKMSRRGGVRYIESWEPN